VNVPQPRMRPGRADAEGQQGVGVGLGRVARLPHRAGEAVHRADDVVGGEHGHRGRLVPRRQQLGRQGDGVGCVAAARLADDVLGRQIRQGRVDQRCVVGVGDDPDLLGGEQVAEPFHGHLEQALAAQKGQELLGAVFPAERPEPLARASGHDDGVSHLRFSFPASRTTVRPLRGGRD
jgi:hypothetical protein